MNCEQTIGKLNAFLDGELAGPEAQAVEEHVAGCARCAAAWEELKGLNRALDALEGMSVPAGFAARVRLAAVVGPRQGVIRRLNGTLTRVAAALLVAAGLWMGLMMGRSVGPADADAGQAVEAVADDLDLQVGALTVPRAESVASAYLDLVDEAE